MEDCHSGGLELYEHRERVLARFVVPEVLPGARGLLSDQESQS